MSEATFEVPGMHCDACERGIRRALESLSGVEDVRVTLASRQVAVRFDPGQTDAQALRARIERAGFDVA